MSKTLPVKDQEGSRIIKRDQITLSSGGGKNCAMKLAFKCISTCSQHSSLYNTNYNSCYSWIVMPDLDSTQTNW